MLGSLAFTSAFLRSTSSSLEDLLLFCLSFRFFHWRNISRVPLSVTVLPLWLVSMNRLVSGTMKPNTIPNASMSLSVQMLLATSLSFSSNLRIFFEAYLNGNAPSKVRWWLSGGSYFAQLSALSRLLRVFVLSTQLRNTRTRIAGPTIVTIRRIFFFMHAKVWKRQSSIWFDRI